MFQIDLTNRFKGSLEKIAKTDKILFAEVNERIKLLAEGYIEQLTIKPIKRKDGQYKVQEIVIRYPSSFRVFYIHVRMDEDAILLVDCRRKKVQKFPSEYFKDLDKCIEKHLYG